MVHGEEIKIPRKTVLAEEGVTRKITKDLIEVEDLLSIFLEELENSLADTNLPLPLSLASLAT